jgi:hypothetical protein
MRDNAGKLLTRRFATFAAADRVVPAAVPSQVAVSFRMERALGYIIYY